MILEFLLKFLPKGMIPRSTYEAKKILHNLGISYGHINVCKNDCTLFWKENKDLDKCPKCDESRYRLINGNGKKIPHKVLRYFPLTPRLKRLCMFKNRASDMRWHKDKRVDDGILRHLANSIE